jgi:hypothetical protein
MRYVTKTLLLTPCQRRKNQVRLAQQAYRQRKDEANATLNEECNQLKETLNHMSDLFDGFFDYATKSRVAQREVEFKRRLSQTAKEIHDLSKSHRDRSKPKNDMKGDAVGRGGSERVTRQHKSQKCSSAETSSRPACDASASPGARSRECLTSIEETSNTLPLTNFLNSDASLHFSGASGSFSSRLRHAGLQRSYRLVRSSNTPMQSLCQVFRYCIFLSSREHIVQRVKFLLHESMKYTISTQNSGKGIIPLNRITHEEEIVWTRHPIAEMNVVREQSLLEQPDPTALMTTNLFGHREDLVDREGELLTTDLREGPTDYMHADNVEEYLLSKGLHISAGAEIVELRKGSLKKSDTPPTLFDELRATQQQVAKVSVRRLLYGK